MADNPSNNNDLIQWCLSGADWLEYRIRRNLLGELPGSASLALAKQKLFDHPMVRAKTKLLSTWPQPVLNSHKSAQHPLHILGFLIDLGMDTTAPAIQDVTDKILASQSPEGPFCMVADLPHTDTLSQETTGWALCDAPLLSYYLTKLGLQDRPEVRRSVTALRALARENGWPCALSPVFGNWRGPGRKADPCPYATLVMLKLLAEYPETHSDADCRAGIEILLDLWENSRAKHPYIFYMGNDFRKPKAPLLWFDILHVCDVLSQFSLARQDGRFIHMMDTLSAAADEDGKFTPRSVYQFWKEWEFGQKKTPSRFITERVLEINLRLEKNQWH